MTPEMYFSKSGVVNKHSLYLRRFSALFSTFSKEANFLPMVPSDSSAAKIPLPGVQILLAVSASSYLNLSAIFRSDCKY